MSSGMKRISDGEDKDDKSVEEEEDDDDDDNKENSSSSENTDGKSPEKIVSRISQPIMSRKGKKPRVDAKTITC